MGKWIKGDDRTLENLLEDNQMWTDNSGDRNSLKNFNNVEFHPLLKTPNHKLLANDFSSTKTIEILPPPGLHVIHLGPVNFIWKELKKHFNMEPFENAHGLYKSDKQKQQFQGPECKKLLRKLNELRDYLTEDLHCFVDILDSINLVYKISFQQGVDPNHHKITAQFEKLWTIAMDKFSITMPLKVHIICHHLSDFFTTTGQTLRKVNDQVVEAAHHKVKMFFESRPNYNHQNKETLSSGEATLAGIIHFNSINI